MRLRYCIFRADYSPVDGEAVDLETAERILRAYDWERQLALQKEMEARGEDACGPRITFYREDRDLMLMLDMLPDQKADVHLSEPWTPQQEALARRVTADLGNGPVTVLVQDSPSQSPHALNAPPLLQYRLLQLYFREDVGDLYRAFAGRY